MTMSGRVCVCTYVCKFRMGSNICSHLHTSVSKPPATWQIYANFWFDAEYFKKFDLNPQNKLSAMARWQSNHKRE